MPQKCKAATVELCLIPYPTAVLSPSLTRLPDKFYCVILQLCFSASESTVTITMVNLLQNQLRYC